MTQNSNTLIPHLVSSLSLVFAIGACGEAGRSAPTGLALLAKNDTNFVTCINHFTDSCTGTVERLEAVCTAFVNEQPVQNMDNADTASWQKLSDEEILLHYVRGFVWALKPNQWPSFESARKPDYHAWLQQGAQAPSLTSDFLNAWKDLNTAIDESFEGGDTPSQAAALQITQGMVRDAELARHIFSFLYEQTTLQRRRQFDLRAGILRDLRVVPTHKIFPHELNDPARVEELQNFLNQTNRWTNPIIASYDATQDIYVVMDGATRTGALKALNVPFAVVHLVSADRGFGLGTWHHVTQKIDETTLIATLAGLPNCRLEPIAEIARTSLVDKLVLDSERTFQTGELAYIELAPDQTRAVGQSHAYAVFANEGVDRMDALNELVAAYTSAEAAASGKVERTASSSFVGAQAFYPNMNALIIHKALTIQDLYDAVGSGKLVPAGMTRSMLSEDETEGRILNIDVPFEWMRTDGDLATKQAELAGPSALNLATRKIKTYGPRHTVCEANGERYYGEALRILQPFESKIFTYEERTQGTVRCN